MAQQAVSRHHRSSVLGQLRGHFRGRRNRSSPYSPLKRLGRAAVVLLTVVIWLGIATGSITSQVILRGAAFNCSSSGYDNSQSCTQSALDAINQARANEGVSAESLPGDWYDTSPTKQLIDAVNSERAARGLPNLPENASADSWAQAAANQGNDSDPAPQDGSSNWGGNAAQGLSNPLEVVWYWMYDDGPGSPNTDCPQAGAPGCYGHRNNIIRSYPGGVMGAGFAVSSDDWTALMEVPPPPPATPPTTTLPPPTPTTTRPPTTVCTP